MSGNATVSRMIGKLRGLPVAMTRDAAPDVAVALEAELRAQIARGESPGGQTWQPTQEGKVPLRGAAKALSVRASGPAIVVTLRGVEALHHAGRVRGRIARPILPTSSDGMPPPFARAIQRVLDQRFRAAMGRA